MGRDAPAVRVVASEPARIARGVLPLDVGRSAAVLEVIETPLPHGVVAQSPEVEDLGATGSALVADGGTLLFRLGYAPKDKVWVVVLKPTIFIQAEEDLLKKEGKKP